MLFMIKIGNYNVCISMKVKFHGHVAWTHRIEEIVRNCFIVEEHGYSFSTTDC